jgi:tripartite ATP-independent transporter DctP family solute receptor
MPPVVTITSPQVMRRAFFTRLTAAASLALALCAGLVSLAHAQVRDQELTLGFQSPRGNTLAEGADRFAEIVAQKSAGRMKINVRPGGALGGDVQTISAVQAGKVAMTTVSAGLMVNFVKEFSLLDLPYLFDSHEEAWAITDGPFGKKIAELLAAKGLIIVGWNGGGFRHLTNSLRPVEKLEDIKGLKVRVLQSPLFIELWQALGANPLPMPFPGLYSVLEQKVVDGQENSASLVLSVKFNEVQKHLTLSRHSYFSAMTVFSKVVWDQLNAEERQVILDAQDDSKWLFRNGAKLEEVRAIETLRKTMQVVDPHAEQIARLRAAARPIVQKYTADADPAVVKVLLSEIDKLRVSK